MNNPPENCPPASGVVPLPVKFKDRDDVRMLVAVDAAKCRHLHVSFGVDTASGRCYCKACDAEVSPIFVLQALMDAESCWMRSRVSYQNEMKRLAERSATKCEHCGEITRISHR